MPVKIIYGLFRINLENLIKTKIHIAKEYHIQPSEIDKLQFFEYELYLEQMNLIAKQQEEENKKQQEDYDSMRSSMNPSKMMNSMGNASQSFKPSSVSAPSMPSISMPSMPKINIPKL